MFELYFGSAFAAVTTLLVVLMIAFILFMSRKGAGFKSWGKAIALFILVGLVVSFASAMRDGYAGPEAMFSMTSMQSNICSIAGGLVLLLGLASIFVRKQEIRRAFFFSISALFMIQVAVIEASRIALSM